MSELPVLTNQQRLQYESAGFLVIENAFSAATLLPIRDAIDDIVATYDPADHRTVFKTTDGDAGRDEVFFRSAESIECFLEDGALNENGELTRPVDRSINKIGHALHDHDLRFTRFCRDSGWKDLLNSLGIESPRLWQTMVIFKQPGIGGEVRWHQDASYLATQPASVIGCWIALEDARLDNGCLWVAPGEHKSPLREIYQVDWQQRKGQLHALDDTPWPDERQAIPVEVKAGSLVLFSDHMPHYSSANTSSNSRLAMTLHFSNADSNWLTENWLQREKLGPFDL